MDREKVIKGLETCIPMKYETNEEKECRHEQCPYGRENYKPLNGCFWDLMSDALALLKERNNCENCAIAIEDRQPVVRCKDCKHGRKHNINIIECLKAHDYNLEHQEFHHKNWYCADGVAKDINATEKEGR